MLKNYKALFAGFSAVVGIGGFAAYYEMISGQTPLKSEVAQPTKVTVVAEPVKPVNEAAKAEPIKPVVVTQPETSVAPSDGSVKTDVKADATKAEAQGAQQDAQVQDKQLQDAQVLAPKFDVLRVEANGSVVIAGKASGGAIVEVLSGTQVLGTTKAQDNGDFVVVMDTQLKSGDYQLVLRETLSDGKSATSIETATVSVPDKIGGQVLALVEEPGEASRIITMPEVAVLAQDTNDPDLANAKDPATAKSEPVVSVKSPLQIVITSVEIEDGRVFVAGTSTSEASIRVYANDTVLGEAKPASSGDFNIEAQKDLSVGDYIISAVVLAPDGVTVLGRSIVPFTNRGDSSALASNNSSTPELAALPAEKPMAVVIRKGDTLWQISRRIYGRGIRFSTIYLANSGALKNPNKIYPGQVISIPSATPEGDAADTQEITKRKK